MRFQVVDKEKQQKFLRWLSICERFRNSYIHVTNQPSRAHLKSNTSKTKFEAFAAYSVVGFKSLKTL